MASLSPYLWKSKIMGNALEIQCGEIKRMDMDKEDVYHKTVE